MKKYLQRRLPGKEEPGVILTRFGAPLTENEYTGCPIPIFQKLYVLWCTKILN